MKKKLLIGVATGAAAVGVFGLIVGLSSMSGNGIQNYIAVPQKQVKTISDLSFKDKTLTLLDSYETVRDRFFTKDSNGTYTALPAKDAEGSESPRDWSDVFKVWAGDKEFGTPEETGNANTDLKDVKSSVVKFLSVTPEDAQKGFLVKFQVETEFNDGTKVESQVVEKLIRVLDQAKFVVLDKAYNIKKEVESLFKDSATTTATPSTTFSAEFEKDVNSATSSEDFKTKLDKYFALSTTLNSLQKSINNEDTFKVEFIKNPNTKEEFATESLENEGVFTVYLKTSLADAFKAKLPAGVNSNFEHIDLLSISKDAKGKESIFITKADVLNKAVFASVDSKNEVKDSEYQTLESFNNTLADDEKITDESDSFFKDHKNDLVISDYDVLTLQRAFNNPPLMLNNYQDYKSKTGWYADNIDLNKQKQDALNKRLQAFIKQTMKFAINDHELSETVNKDIELAVGTDAKAKRDETGLYVEVPYTIKFKGKTSPVKFVKLRKFNQYSTDQNPNPTIELNDLSTVKAIFAPTNGFDTENEGKLVFNPSQTNQISKSFDSAVPISSEELKKLVEAQDSDKLLSILKNNYYQRIRFSEKELVDALTSDNSFKMPTVEEIKNKKVKFQITGADKRNRVYSINLFKTDNEVGQFFAHLLTLDNKTVEEYLKAIYEKFQQISDWFARLDNPKDVTEDDKKNKIKYVSLSSNQVQFLDNEDLSIFPLRQFTKNTTKDFVSSQVQKYFKSVLGNEFIEKIKKDNVTWKDYSLNGVYLEDQQGTANTDKQTEILSEDDFVKAFFVKAALENNFQGYRSLGSTWKSKIKFEIAKDDEVKNKAEDTLTLNYWYEFYVPQENGELGNAVYKTAKVGINLKVATLNSEDFAIQQELNKLVKTIPQTETTFQGSSLGEAQQTKLAEEQNKLSDERYKDFKKEIKNTDESGKQVEEKFVEYFGQKALDSLKAYIGSDVKLAYQQGGFLNNRTDFNQLSLRFYLAKLDPAWVKEQEAKKAAPATPAPDVTPGSNGGNNNNPQAQTQQTKAEPKWILSSEPVVYRILGLDKIKKTMNK